MFLYHRLTVACRQARSGMIVPLQGCRALISVRSTCTLLDLQLSAYGSLPLACTRGNKQNNDQRNNSCNLHGPAFIDSADDDGAALFRAWVRKAPNVSRDEGFFRGGFFIFVYGLYRSA